MGPWRFNRVLALKIVAVGGQTGQNKKRKTEQLIFQPEDVCLAVAVRFALLGSSRIINTVMMNMIF